MLVTLTMPSNRQTLECTIAPRRLCDRITATKVQENSTFKTPFQVKKIPFVYEQRLRHLELTTLKERRIRGDLIETFKIMTGKERVDRSQFFQLSTCGYQLRGHTMKLSKQRTSLGVGKFSFSQRVVIGVEQVISRCCGCYVCESVQE